MPSKTSGQDQQQIKYPLITEIIALISRLHVTKEA